MRAGVATLWLSTGLLVVTPYYREVGHEWLSRLGLGDWAMYICCVGEVLLGVRLLFPWGRPWAIAQGAVVLAFSVVLGTLDPLLLVHPYGMVSKNLPFLGLVAAVALVQAEGWTPRALWTLRAGMAVVWFTEGLLPKVVFQQPMELAVVANSGLVPVDPGTFLMGLGLAQAGSGAAALLLRGRPAATLLLLQGLAVILLPALVSWQDPALWLHPFGPMTKNIPILVGTWTAAWQLWRTS